MHRALLLLRRRERRNDFGGHYRPRSRNDSGIHGNGGSTVFDVASDKSTVGEALSSIGLISGEQGDYGLYVKTVNGITADYDKDGTYWAFSVNGELSQKGVDQTYVKNGDIYTFTVTK